MNLWPLRGGTWRERLKAAALFFFTNRRLGLYLPLGLVSRRQITFLTKGKEEIFMAIKGIDPPTGRTRQDQDRRPGG